MNTQEKRELAGEAKLVLENKAYQWAILELRRRWFQELLGHGGVGKETVRLTAQINALEAVATELAIAINNYKVELKRA